MLFSPTPSLLSAKCHINPYSFERTSVVTFRLFRAIAHVGSRRVLTADFRFLYEAIPCGICGGPSVTGTDSCRNNSVYSCQNNPIIVAHSSSCTCCPLTEGRAVGTWEIPVLFRISGSVVQESTVNFVVVFFKRMCIFRALRCLFLCYIKVKCSHHSPGCGTEGGYRYSSTLPSPRHQKGVSDQEHAPAALYHRDRPGAHCSGGWVGPRAGLDGGNSRSTGIRSPDRPTHIQSLYRLTYPVHNFTLYICI